MTDGSNLIETIATIDRLSTFSRLMQTSGANEVLNVGGDFTVFAPTNDAFCKIPDNQMNALLQEAGQTTLKSLLSYHILPGKFSAAELALRDSAATITDLHVKLTDSRAGLIVNDSGVQTTNIEAANGIVHELDTVLIYGMEGYKTGPLKPPVARSAAEPEPELAIPTLSAGKTDEAEKERVTYGFEGTRTGQLFAARRRSSYIF